MTGKGEIERFDEDEIEPAIQGTGTPNLRAAVAAHLAGFGWDTIAERYGYGDPKSAQVAVETLIGRTWSSSDITAARGKSRARKERLLQSIWWDSTHPFLVDDEGKQTKTRNEAHLMYLDRAIRLSESIDRLDGLNQPTQVEIYRPGADEFLTTVAQLRQELMGDRVREGNIFDELVVEPEDEDEADDGRS